VTDCSSAGGIDPEQLLQIAASGCGSHHPLSRALLAHAQAQNIQLSPISAYKELSGSGIRQISPLRLICWARLHLSQPISG
jgi:cation transport ATPase